MMKLIRIEMLLQRIANKRSIGYFFRAMVREITMMITWLFCVVSLMCFLPAFNEDYSVEVVEDEQTNTLVVMPDVYQPVPLGLQPNER